MPDGSGKVLLLLQEPYRGHGDDYHLPCLGARRRRLGKWAISEGLHSLLATMPVPAEHIFYS